MAEELLVVLRRSEHSGFGFSLLGQPGLPPIIYDIVEDSPAAESGKVRLKFVKKSSMYWRLVLLTVKSKLKMHLLTLKTNLSVYKHSNKDIFD